MEERLENMAIVRGVRREVIAEGKACGRIGPTDVTGKWAGSQSTNREHAHLPTPHLAMSPASKSHTRRAITVTAIPQSPAPLLSLR